MKNYLHVLVSYASKPWDMIKIHDATMIWGRFENSPKSFFFIFPVNAQQRAAFSVFSLTYEKTQSAARYLQKQLLTHLRSNLGYCLYASTHPSHDNVCMSKHYLEHRNWAWIGCKNNRNQVEVAHLCVLFCKWDVRVPNQKMETCLFWIKTGIQINCKLELKQWVILLSYDILITDSLFLF